MIEQQLVLHLCANVLSWISNHKRSLWPVKHFEIPYLLTSIRRWTYMVYLSFYTQNGLNLMPDYGKFLQGAEPRKGFRNESLLLFKHLKFSCVYLKPMSFFGWIVQRSRSESKVKELSSKGHSMAGGISCFWVLTQCTHISGFFLSKRRLARARLKLPRASDFSKKIAYRASEVL